MKSRRSSVVAFLALFITIQGIFSPVAFAQRPTPNTNCIDDTGQPDPDKVYVSIANRCVDVDEFSSIMLNALIIIGVLASVYRLSVGFFMIVTAEAEPQRLQNGREAITEAIVGVTVVVSAYALISILGGSLPQNWLINLT